MGGAVRNFFGVKDVPAPVAPPDTTASDKAKQEQADAARAAQAEQAGAGRASTIVAGASLYDTDTTGDGALAAKKKNAAARSILG